MYTELYCKISQLDCTLFEIVAVIIVKKLTILT